MRKSLVFLLAGSIFASCLPFDAAAAEDISAAAAIVYEPFSGTVLYEKNADERMLIASTTKILTALVVLENCELDEKVQVSAAHAAVEGSSMYLCPGGDYTVEDLLYGLMLASGNDAAAALADHTAGSMEGFALLMNERCTEMGLKDSHFVNSHGLDDPEHYSTARELALICAEAMKNADFCRIFAAESYSCGGNSYYNHNKLLKSCEGCIGGKTGYTEKAGRILVSCTEREGMRLICVTISAPRDWDDHRSLYADAFEEYEYFPIPGRDSIPVISGKDEEVGIFCHTAGIVAEKEKGAEMRIYLPSFVFSPVRAGEKAGEAELIIPGEGSRKFDIFYSGSVSTDESMRVGSMERIKQLRRSAAGIGVYVPAFKMERY